MKSANTRPTLALLAGAVLFSTGAYAMPPGEQTLVRSETVKFDPAQAATPEGAAALYGELQKAALKVCADPVPRSLRYAAEIADREACTKDALGKAVQHVGIAMVTTLHSSGAGRPVTEMASR